MSWLSTLPAFLVTALLMFAPGAALALSMGARGLVVAGLAPLASVGIIGVAGVAAGAIGLGWGIVPIIAVTAAAAGFVLLLRRTVLKKFSRTSAREIWPLWAASALGLVLGAVLVGRRMIAVIGSPENFAQRFDNVFHMNAVQYILQTGNASTLTLGRMTAPEQATAIYPSAWHSFAAATAQLTGTDVVVSTNVLNIVVAALVWPVSLILLTYAVLGAKPVALALAGVFSGAFSAFPLSIMDFGPLYPNILAYAVLPAAIAVVISLFNLSARTLLDKPSLWIMLLVSAAALVFAQPNGLLSLIAISLPIGLWAAAKRFRTLSPRRETPKFVVTTVATLAGLASFALAWKTLRPADYTMWTPFTTQAGAIGESLMNAQMGRQVAWLVSLSAIVGLYLCIRKGHLAWVALCWLVPVILYVTTASQPRGAVRSLLVGGWYSDSYRLAALIPIFTTVLAALAGASLWQLARRPAGRALQRRPQLRRFRPTLVVAGVLATVIIGGAAVFTQGGPMTSVMVQSSKAYAMSPGASVVDSNELALIERLPDAVPEDAVIAVNPWNGGAAAYGLAGRKVTMYHMFQTDDADLKLLDKSLGMSASGSAACEIAQRRNIRFILDFGSKYLANSNASKLFPGLVDVPASPFVKVVDSEGPARLLEVNCG